jgi:hypothetical protein
MEQSVEKIIERNLLEVFNGRDADSRRAAIDELWDKDGVFIDPGGVLRASKLLPPGFGTPAKDTGHVGKAKSAQRNKVLGDVLKLALVTSALRRSSATFQVESYI